MNRYRELEKLQETVRSEIPSVAVDWLAAVRKEMEKLTKAALSGDLTDEQFRALVEKTSKRLPELLDKMNHEALSGLMEKGMGAAMANGMAERLKTARPKTQEKRAKLPWEKDVLLGARGGGKGKRCGNSWIPRWKRCGKDDGREWEEANAEEAVMLSRVSGKKLKGGARILATPEGIRHAEKGHAHQLTEKDWQQLRGRMFDPRTEKKPVLTKIREDAIQFNFPRGGDQMEAVFTVHASKGVFPGELRLKTFKMLDPRDILRKKNEDSGG